MLRRFSGRQAEKVNLALHLRRRFSGVSTPLQVRLSLNTSVVNQFFVHLFARIIIILLGNRVNFDFRFL